MRYVQAAGALNVLLQASPPGHGPGSPSGNDPNGSFGAASQHSAQGAGSYHSAHHGPVLELSSPAASPKGEEGSSGRGCPALGALQMGPRKPFVEGFQGMEFEPGHRIQLLHYLGVLVSRAYPLLQDMEEHPEPGVEAHVMRPIDSSDGVMAATEGVAT